MYNLSFDESRIDSNSNFWSNSLLKVFLQQATATPDGICTNLDKVSNTTLQFIDYFDACYQQCNMTDDCSAYELGNGVCDVGLSYFDVI